MPTGDPNIPWDVKEAKRIHWQMAGAAELKTGSPDKVADMTSVNANGGAIDDDSDADDEEPVDFTRGPYNNDVDLLGEENNEDDFDKEDAQGISEERQQYWHYHQQQACYSFCLGLEGVHKQCIQSQAEQQGE